MYKLQITSLYHRELDEIIVYIAGHLKNPLAATRLLDEITDCYTHLKKHPKCMSIAMICDFLGWGTAKQ